MFNLKIGIPWSLEIDGADVVVIYLIYQRTAIPAVDGLQMIKESATLGKQTALPGNMAENP